MNLLDAKEPLSLFEQEMGLFLDAFFSELRTNPAYDKEDIAKLKVRLCRGFSSIKKIPTDIELYLRAETSLAKEFKQRLQTKPNRSLSGVTPLAVMTSPHSCPHGKCRMCPGGIDSPWGDQPQSYTGAEPAAMRAYRANYSAFIQVFNRLEQYVVTGHSPQKNDVIIMGGTFPARPSSYQELFVTEMFLAMNTFSDLFFPDNELDIDSFKEFFELPGNIHDPERIQRIHKKILLLKKPTTLSLEKEKNETSAIRCIGLTIETRPDWGFKEHGNSLLELGATRVELGIQSVSDMALEKISRGHSSSDAKRSIQELKDLGFKLNLHIMLGLPSISQQQDILNIKQLFSDDAYRPDMIKLYPLLVMPGTLLEQDMREGLFKPLTRDQAVDILVSALPFVPEYCRVMRVQRDIPTYRIVGGVDKTNLRQYVDNRLLQENISLQEIRARETGRKKITQEPRFEIKVTSYVASGGKEFFIAVEDIANNAIAGFCRLRFPSQCLRSEITKKTALIRELHVYGQSKKLTSQDTLPSSLSDSSFSSQHKGFGKLLMKKAEELAKDNGYDHVLVISGVGVRKYYEEQLGYSLEGPYMGKHL
jgi:elongator complex protein 3